MRRNGQSLYFTVQEGGTARLYRVPVSGGQPQRLDWNGAVAAWSVAKDLVACTVTTASSPGELYLKRGDSPATALTSLNRDLLATKKIAEVESFRFKAADGLEIEAFLTKPLSPSLSINPESIP